MQIFSSHIELQNQCVAKLPSSKAAGAAPNL
jgi:hypothetical protein